MKWAAVLMLIVYAALKGTRLAFAGRKSGYRDDPPSLWERLRAGEPALLILAAVLSVPTTLGAITCHRQHFSEVLHNSVNCYGLLATYSNAPEITRSYGEHAVYGSFDSSLFSAHDAAWQLGMSYADIRKQLDHAAAIRASERGDQNASTHQYLITLTRQCLPPARSNGSA